MSDSCAPICDLDGEGLFFPLGGRAEQCLGVFPRILLYGVGLAYCFLGVSVVADLFMDSIEAITSRKQRVRVKETGRYITVHVWNDTVANLTLMALGSSAPEILLSVVEVLKKEFFSGVLGPSTIVGSAAFNLLVIIAVCIVVIPNGETRIIKEVPVFIVTGIFSLLAYVWLLVIVSVSSPEIIDIWEGIATLLLLPVLVLVSFLCDQGWFSGSGVALTTVHPRICVKDDPGAFNKVVPTEGPSDNDPTPPAAPCWEPVKPKQAASNCLALPDLPPTASSSFYSSQEEGCPVVPMVTAMVHASSGSGGCLVPPEQPPHSVSSGGSSWVSCSETNCNSVPDVVSVAVARHSGGAGGDGDSAFSSSSTSLRSVTEKVEPGATAIGAAAAKDAADGDASILWATKTADPPDPPSKYEPQSKALAAPMPPFDSSELIRDLDGERIANSSGVFSFACDVTEVKGGLEPRTYVIPVWRCNGRCGPVSCTYRMEKLTAIPGYDYTEESGKLEFGHGVDKQNITVTILPKEIGEHSDQFQIILEDNEGGAAFNPNDDGGEECCVLTIIVANENDALAKTISQKGKRIIDKVLNLDQARWGTKTWAENIRDACSITGDDDDEDDEDSTPSKLDLAVNALALPWKLLYAILIPPSVYLGGWVAFCLSMLHIGALTAVILDLAELFGCVAGVENSLTAITFVALGTSMPDLFASRSAAVEDQWADAAIVNVTGSNSVNVFLGIGLPWTLGAIYWKVMGQTDAWLAEYGHLAATYPDAAFVVQSGNLVFSVVIFGIAAVIALAIIRARRILYGCELGGPFVAKVTSAFVMVALWFWYIGMYAWKMRSQDSSLSEQAVAVAVSLTVVLATASLAARGFCFVMGW